MIEVKIKEGVLFTTDHFEPGVARIITVAGEEWPEGYPIVITRGAEDCPGSKPNSRHLYFEAFDLRSKHLPATVDRNDLLKRIMAQLGPHYYGYWKNEPNNGSKIMAPNSFVEWFHFQFNGG